ncbi:MAG: hypothetical protein F6K19_01850 [Cyanothece sp. SIO1E1]|nr:hypothetical protein [Cyanothece sp. SIO1E1]
MAPQKLSDADKRDILNLYRQPEETTSTLASRYGVSNSTISRILKNGLPDQDYESLVQQKRSALSKSQPSSEVILQVLPSSPETQVPIESGLDRDIEADSMSMEQMPVEAGSTTLKRRQRKRSSAAEVNPQSQEIEATQLPLLTTNAPIQDATVATDLKLRSTDHAQAEDSATDDGIDNSVLTEFLAEDLTGQDDEFDDEDDTLADDEDDSFDEDLEDDDLEDDDLADEDGLDDESDIIPLHVQREALVQVLPLSEATIPKPFYLVVDRGSDLITRPLRDFGELGQIPTEEFQERTLPIFDNHRVARRFSKRNQRVVKVPDGRMLAKTSSYLQAKGITRLLIDGQIYAL